MLLHRVAQAVDAWYDEQGRLQIEPKKAINLKLGEGRSTDALDAIALTLAVDVAIVEADSNVERMRRQREAYEADPYGFARDRDYNPVGVMR